MRSKIGAALLALSMLILPAVAVAQDPPVDLCGNVATVTAVTNAIAYQALYHPLLTCWVNRPSETGTRGDATYAWQLTAEEV